MNWEPLWALGLAVTSALVRRMPPRVRYPFARGVGRSVGRLFPEKRRALERNLAVLNPLSGRTVTPAQVFENFAMTLADFLSHAPVEIRVEGREKIDAARRAGRGVLFLTSHLGNWELGGRVLAGWGLPVTAVFQPYRSRAMQSFIQNRREPGLNYLAVGKGAALGVSRVLAKGESVALLADRPFGEIGESVSLCGRPARLPRGPFLFAARAGAPLVPGFVLMEGPGRYRVVLEEPLWPTGKGHAAVQKLLDKMAQVLEKYLTRHADQWYCFEPAWDEGGG